MITYYFVECDHKSERDEIIIEIFQDFTSSESSIFKKQL